jgi:elongation factor Ts
MAEIKAADVAKLRKITGAGMMDCKKALQESNGDYDAAMDILRKKGQKIANNRADRDATEGAVIAKVAGNNKKGVIIVVNCETDFVAKNDDFVAFANEVAEIGIVSSATTVEELKSQNYKGVTLESEIVNKVGVIGEKIDLSYFAVIEAEQVVGYIHPGNKLASLVGFNKEVDGTLAKDVAMQVAAMAPVGIDKDDVSQNIIDKEIEIGKEQAIQEGKPADLAEKISIGKLNKFFKDSTLLNQQFIKDNKATVGDILKQVDKSLTVISIKRYALAD